MKVGKSGREHRNQQQQGKALFMHSKKVQHYIFIMIEQQVQPQQALAENNGQAGNNLAPQEQQQQVKEANQNNLNTMQSCYNWFTAEDGNEVWAGALTLAWQEMAKLANVENLQVKDSPAGEKAAYNYNHCPFTQEDLKPESRYTKSGLGQPTVEQINFQRAKHFPQCTFPLLDLALAPEAAISYSYLYKKLTYKFKFERRQQNTLKFKCNNGEIKQVPSFYAEDERQYDQVKVYEYTDNDNFILKLITNDSNEEVFAYKVNDDVKLNDVIKKIIEVSKKTEEIYSVAEVESFEFPILDFDYSRSVEELIGAQLANFAGRRIQAIIEGVKLKLDQNGVVVENEGMMFTDECGVFNPRVMRIDSPFWLVMKEKDKHPYLCIRVNNL